MSKHREAKAGKNPMHGNATLLSRIRETESISGQSKAHGSSCGACVHFGECSKVTVKNVPADSRVCHWAKMMFESAQ